MISDVLPKSEKNKLLELVEPIDKPSYRVAAKLDILRNPLIDESQREILRGFERISEFQTFSIENWNLSLIPEGKLKAMASLLRRMDKNKKLAHIIAFIYEYRKKAMDEQILALSKYFEAIFRNAKNQEVKERIISPYCSVIILNNKSINCLRIFSFMDSLVCAFSLPYNFVSLFHLPLLT